MKKPKPKRRFDQILTISVTQQQKNAIIKLADKISEGNVCRLVRHILQEQTGVK